ncbi:MAG: DsbA family protein [Candidatus Ruthia sp.]|nr:DsbA family protein [Candidatus Ruthturnera sp.]
MNSTTLYYIFDPMCSWCWGFNAVWKKVKASLPDSINIQYVLGGLAPDSDEPMNNEMRDYIVKNWQKIEMTIPGTKFNYDFWENCQPKRSTYPACRAVIAVREQKPKLQAKMTQLIQKAYYLEAQNPSEDDTLIALASTLDIDIKNFGKNLNDTQTQALLLNDIALSKKLGVNSFPSLVLQTNNKLKLIKINYNNPDLILNQIIT